eukprot:CAMPEP_0174843110 /NCGR_PEP_ID=MMETSP1114-20130205/10312_1 /TAXON_ID=312471 /ORGANISM="Neobodo designis, Strain CCAP 1951/1" /LENGTH=586 /DNA_ID=CAMNT_0016077323 /DNA_START=31 /DNA_END=1787 /DNA_ORIENTATION=+
MSTYEDLFHTIDTDHNGELSLEEFSSFCETLPQAPATSVIQRLFNQADVDNSGFIDETEFAALCDGVKLLTKLTEHDMVEAYATSELRRLFQYSASNGVCLRKSELRKAADVLNEGLNLRITSDALAQTVHRECHEDEVSFHQFKSFVHKLAPKHGLSAIVAAFREEECRRKERLTKVKSMFELRPKGQTALDGRRGQLTTAASAPCQHCQELEVEIEDLLRKDSQARLSIDDLSHKLLAADEKVALMEVESQRKLKVVERELDEAKAEVLKMESKLSVHEKAAQNHGSELETAQEEVRRLREEIARYVETIDSNEATKGEVEHLAHELRQCQERLARSHEEKLLLQKSMHRLEAQLEEKSTDVEQMRRLMEEIAESKQTQDEQARRFVDEIKRQCSDREEAAREQASHAAALRARVQCLEEEVNAREDAVTEREKRLRLLEAKQRAKWEEKFVKAAQDLTVRENQLQNLEVELSTRNAELQVREQLLEQNVKRAEAISLPERERRLRVLQGVEVELCERERRLRQAESGYLAKLLDPRIEELREENKQLREHLAEARAERDASSNYAKGVAVRSSGGLEKGMMSP